MWTRQLEYIPKNFVQIKINVYAESLFHKWNSFDNTAILKVLSSDWSAMVNSASHEEEFFFEYIFNMLE